MHATKTVVTLRTMHLLLKLLHQSSDLRPRVLIIQLLLGLELGLYHVVRRPGIRRLEIRRCQPAGVLIEVGLRLGINLPDQSKRVSSFRGTDAHQVLITGAEHSAWVPVCAEIARLCGLSHVHGDVSSLQRGTGFETPP